MDSNDLTTGVTEPHSPAPRGYYRGCNGDLWPIGHCLACGQPIQSPGRYCSDECYTRHD